MTWVWLKKIAILSFIASGLLLVTCIAFYPENYMHFFFQYCISDLGSAQTPLGMPNLVGIVHFKAFMIFLGTGICLTSELSGRKRIIKIFGRVGTFGAILLDFFPNDIYPLLHLVAAFSVFIGYGIIILSDLFPLTSNADKIVFILFMGANIFQLICKPVKPDDALTQKVMLYWWVVTLLYLESRKLTGRENQSKSQPTNGKIKWLRLHNGEFRKTVVKWKTNLARSIASIYFSATSKRNLYQQ